MKSLLIILSLLAFIACSSTSKKESTGQYVDSAAITAKVKAQFAKDKRVSFLDVKVETFKNKVQLSGWVDSFQEKELAEVLAEKVSGVEEVINNIKVK